MGKNKKCKKCKSWQSESQINKASWGLFYRRGWRWFLNIKDIPIYFKRIFFVIKHGYYPQAKWETFFYFISAFREILVWYKDHRSGDIVLSFDDYNDEENHKNVQKLYEEMIDLIDRMNEYNPLYDNWEFLEASNSMCNAKDHFMKLFSQYFYDFWD